MSGGGTQNSLRKTLGALKDTTTVSLAKINSDYKELDIAIVKATNHVERPAKERHIKAVFAAISATRPRADVAYCIHALARRLSKTHNWAVALKTLIVIHRALREVDPTFQEEILNYGRSRNHMLNLAHFKDDSSPNAWDYSAWVRCYALFLEERLECFRVLKYDIEAERLRMKDLDTPQLLEQLPALQQLLYRVLGCQPQGAAIHNFIIQLALSMVASESIKIYNAISDGTVNLVDKFFEMQRHDALKALDIYRRAGQQAERLSEFFEICKSLDVGRGERYIKIEQPPASFLQAMEEYVREAPRVSTTRKDLADDKPKAMLAIEYKKSSEVNEERPPSPPPPETEPEPQPVVEPVKVEAPASEPPPDLLGLHEPLPAATELDEKNAMALAIASWHVLDKSVSFLCPGYGTCILMCFIKLHLTSFSSLCFCKGLMFIKLSVILGIPALVGGAEQPGSTGSNLGNGTTGWELALVTAPSSNESAASASKLVSLAILLFTVFRFYSQNRYLATKIIFPFPCLFSKAGGLDKLTLDSLYDDAIRRNNQNVSYNPWEQAPMGNSMMPQVAHDPFYASNAVAAPPSVQMAAMSNQHHVYPFQPQPQPQMMMGPQQPINPFGTPYGTTGQPYGPGMPVQAYNPYSGFI
ncbi:UNVERIFIED_CONTAM: putative clathrin assembly protein [Sesamum angustifolium]|uniref:Clathrin assembly protein n=1 Tax=Sesamum angustifolium TaxID=2727405 RepID=A0AAW2MTU3_9LAMI